MLKANYYDYNELTRQLVCSVWTGFNMFENDIGVYGLYFCVASPRVRPREIYAK